jgi:Nucleotidyl transferase AbiEii toxin, Type IV TA system
MIAREQQFAEKIHAYTVPRPSLNSRVRDLVDLHLLIASDSLDISLCGDALRRTFERRNTHELPKELVPPPADWDRPFRVLAEECRIDIGYREAFDTLLSFWAAL